jgi:hypothetical protein
VNRIRPCHKGQTGPRVFDLHVGLLYIISYEPGISDNDRATLVWQLKHDWPGHVYTGWTENIVFLWQGQFINPPQEWNFPYPQDWPPGTRPTGDVDPRTAKALNARNSARFLGRSVISFLNFLMLVLERPSDERPDQLVEWAPGHRNTARVNSAVAPSSASATDVGVHKWPRGRERMNVAR